MSDYISREALTKGFKIWQNTLIEIYGKNDEYVKCLDSVLLGIDSIPAADVRPVVLCGDCEFYGCRMDALREVGFCKRTDANTGAFDFCSQGEKREANDGT